MALTGTLPHEVCEGVNIADHVVHYLIGQDMPIQIVLNAELISMF